MARLDVRWDPAPRAAAALTAGAYHTCRVEASGTLACWGNNTYGQSVPPSGTFTRVSAGTYHNCAICTNGTLACWGWNNSGQITVPPGTYRDVAKPAASSIPVRSAQISPWTAGDTTNTERVRRSRAPLLRSAPERGTTARSAPTARWSAGARIRMGRSTSRTGSFTQVSAGNFHTCAIRTNGTLECWGQNMYGELNKPHGQLHAGLGEQWP